MSAQPDLPVAKLVMAADKALDRSREEIAYQAYGRALEAVNATGVRLLADFARLEKEQNAITDSRFGQVTPCFAKAVESAWATWRAGNKNALERGAERERAAADDDVPGWVST